MGPTATTVPSFRDLRRPEEIEALGHEWDALLASGGRPSPFQLSSLRKRLKKVERLHRAYRSGSLRASGERAA